jgi:asparagine synthase (glutamine-hydrolysing)
MSPSQSAGFVDVSLTRDGWVSRNGTFVRGAAFDGDILLSASGLAETFAGCKSDEQFVEKLKCLNGFFAVVQVIDRSCRFAVDRVRSIPLFYSLQSGVLRVSDCDERLASMHTPRQRNEVGEAEFFHVGYVTSRDTREEGVWQCLAGEMVSAESGADASSLRSIPYFLYQHAGEDPGVRPDWEHEFQEVLDRVFGRLIRFADGRPIVVPLSGGFDSRLIALMLRRLGYPKVLAFSYGVPGNAESVVSQHVAGDLRVPWEFVPYSMERWGQWYHSEDRLRYERYSGTLTSLPHYQDWPAIRELVGSGRISKESIVVPGHSADLLAGSRSGGLPRLYCEGKPSLPVLIDACLRFHYCLWSRQFSGDPARSQMVARLEEQLLGIVNQGATSNASVFETWDWQNRQAKFIVNAVRVYESAGLDWWLPFWDKEFMDFWRQVPMSKRVRKTWYDRFVDGLYRDIVGQECSPVGLRTQPMKRVLRSVFGGRALSRVVRQCLPACLCLPDRSYQSHPLAIHGLMSSRQFLSYWTGRENINSFLVADILQKIAIEAPCVHCGMR